MKELYELLYWVHLPAAMLSLPAFWLAVLSKKGGVFHVRVGRCFAITAILAALMGMGLAGILILAPESRGAVARRSELATRRTFGVLLLYVGLITAWACYHGWRVVRSRRSPEAIQTPTHSALSVLPALGSGAVLVMGLAGGNLKMQLLATCPVGFLLTLGSRRYLSAPSFTRMSWWFEHMISMFAAGIGLHTGFAVFFLDRVLEVPFGDVHYLVPWLGPTALGVPVMLIWTRLYYRRFLSHEAE